MKKDIQIVNITDVGLKQDVSRNILEDLTDWFGIQSSTEKYISDTADQVFYAAEQDGDYVGFISLKKTSAFTAEIAVMGVLRKNRGRGIGKALFEVVRKYAKDNDCEFLQVKTVEKGIYKQYDDTNAFYESLGFRPFETIPSLWDEGNPCQIYVMSLK